MASSFLDQTMLFITDRRLWVAVGVITLVFAFYRRDKNLLIFCLIMVVTVTITDAVAYHLLKQSFAIERPCHSLGVRLVASGCSGKYGFPSNHASNGMAATVVTGLFFRRRKVWLVGFILVALVGFSRVYIGVHYPIDVLVGFLFGAFMGGAIFYIYSKVISRIDRHS